MDYSVFNQLKLPACIIDSGGELIYKNDVFAGLISAGGDVNGGSIALDVTHPFYNEYRRKIALSYHRVLSGFEARCFAVLKGADGQQKPVEIYLYPLSNENGMSQILAFFKQVDDRIVSFDGYSDRDEIAKDNENLFEFSPFPIVRVEQSGEIKLLSASVELITGYTKEEILEKNSRIYEIFNSYDVERLKNAIRDILEGYLSFKRLNDLKIVTHKNEDRYSNAVLYPVMSDKKIVAAEILFEDITRISYLEKRLTSMNRGNIVGDMIEGLLHSFSNVVNIVLSSSQIMMQQTEKETLLDGLRTIYDAALDGGKQIRRVQDFMNESETSEETSENLLDVVDDAIEFTKIKFKVERKDKVRDIRITRQFFVKGVVTGNIHLLKEIIISMIYRVAGYVSESGEVHVEIRQSSDYVISVSTQKDSSYNEDLQTADIEIRRLAERIHLRIVEEESNEKIVIKSILPSRMVSRDVADDVSAEVSRLRDKDILVVEDEEALGEILFQLFDSMGNRVVVHDNGDDAASSIASKNFDIAISDYQIPGMTGIDLLRRIKAKNPSTVTILLSGWSLNANAEQDGVDLFLSKPFQIDVLLKEIAATKPMPLKEK